MNKNDKVRVNVKINLSDNECEEKMSCNVGQSILVKTPANGRTTRSGRQNATTSKKLQQNEEICKVKISSKTTVKKSLQREPSPNQTRIHSFFKSSTKSYTIEADVVKKVSPSVINTNKITRRRAAQTNSSTNNKATNNVKSNTAIKRRKRLFVDDVETTTTEASISNLTDITPTPVAKTNGRKRKTPAKSKKGKPEKKKKAQDCIVLSSESETEVLVKFEIKSSNKENCTSDMADKPMVIIPSTSPILQLQPKTLPTDNIVCDIEVDDEDSIAVTIENSNLNVDKKGNKSKSNRRPKPCPPYKIITDTTFAVDAFQFGQIEGVTHYFLTHFHADHYIGLTRKFSKPIYMSHITASLVREFIKIDEQFIYEISLNEPQVINGIEVTAIDANHCPGAVMYIYKFANGKCILHTGDFRACPNMESEPIFWNNDIDTIYLDTTYISDRYAFCTQSESIDSAIHLIYQFRAKYKNERILYICGSYLIGKEKFWSALAREFELKVWTEEKRRKALDAMHVPELQALLCDNIHEANMHVLAMGKLNYSTLLHYLQDFSASFDMLLAIRPSGWEKNSRPQYRGKINIIGIEYSEHSSYNEMQRFVTYLKPRDVISTVPTGRSLMVTSKVPQKWYKYDKLTGMQRNFQPSIRSYLKSMPSTTPLNKSKQKFSLKQISPMNSTPLAILGSPCDDNPVCGDECHAPDTCESSVVLLASQNDTKYNNKSPQKAIPIDADADDDWLS